VTHTPPHKILLVLNTNTHKVQRYGASNMSAPDISSDMAANWLRHINWHTHAQSDSSIDVSAIG